MKKTLKSIDLSLISQLVLGILVLLIGFIVMVFKSFGLIEIVLYISILFYIYAFFSTMMYFVKRNEGDYELLLLSLINIITATFMFIFKSDSAPMILGAGMSIYTILVILNRGCKILLLKRRNNFMWIIKFVITFLIGFLGILTTFNLFNEVTVQTMMFGFYFMSLGFMLTIENIIEIFITDTTFKRILSKIIEDDPSTKKLENIEEKIEADVQKKKTAKKITTEKAEEKLITKKVVKPKKNETTKEEEKDKETVKKSSKSKKIETNKDDIKITKEKKSNSLKKDSSKPKETKAKEPKKTETIKVEESKVTVKKAGRPKKTINKKEE